MGNYIIIFRKLPTSYLGNITYVSSNVLTVPRLAPPAFSVYLENSHETPHVVIEEKMSFRLTLGFDILESSRANR
jgi:hypothetical protein